MFTLYSRPNSGSAAIEALLAELGVDFKLHDVPRSKDGSIPADLVRVNPLGKIPVLQLPDDSVMTESAAMMIYLADQFPAAGLFPNYNRPRYLQWMLYFASTVYMADLRFYYPARHSVDEVHASAIKQKAANELELCFAHFASELGAGPFILGEHFSAVDIYAAMLLSWSPDLEALFLRHANLKEYYFRIAARPKIADVWVRNRMPV
jgi:glutathione S-transferase